MPTLSPLEVMPGVELTAPPQLATLPLQPWECAFAEWLALHDDPPTTAEQRKFVSAILKRPVSSRQVTKTRRKPALQEYLRTLQLGALRAARSMLEARYPEAVKAHYEGLALAVSNKDVRAIPSFTVPILDRVVPKHDALQANTQVNVVITTKRATVANSEPVDVEFEVVEPETRSGS